MGSTPSENSNMNVKKYFNKLQGNTLIQEKSFDASIIVCKEIWPIVQYHRWERFWTIPKETAVVPIVQEFYAPLWDYDS